MEVSTDVPSPIMSRTGSVAVIGCGAVGTVFAAAAERSGLDTVVCVRSPVDRLVLEVAGQVKEIAIRVTDDPARVDTVDWVLLTTKAQDTEAARQWLARLCGPGTVVVVLQNGVEHRERVQPLVGDAAVLPALVYIAAERIAPGHVVHRRGRRVIVPAGRIARAFSAVMAPTSLEVVEEADFTTAAWRKLLSNVAANPITALTSRRLGVLRDTEVRVLASTLLAEAISVGVAEGARLDADDVRGTLEFFDQFADQDGTSMLYDRLAGRPLEYEQISGVVTRLGRRHRVPTPTNQALYALLGAL
jgi:2-dehydropantoate 2-reductase